MVNKLPFELHLPGHSFTGPGTKLYKRLNANGTPKEWSIPLNRVDNAAYHRDLCYSKHDDTKTRNEVCDKTMLGELGRIVNPTLRERIDKSIVENSSKLKLISVWAIVLKTNLNLLMSSAEELYKSVTRNFQRRSQRERYRWNLGCSFNRHACIFKR